MPAATRTRHSRRGLTLLELLVTISIVALLTAMLLPAVAAARESCRKVVCQNHARQVGLALADHAAARGRYPTQQRDVWTIDVAAATHGPAIAERMQASLRAGTAATEEAFLADVPLFRCPSDVPAWVDGYPVANLSFNPALLGRRPTQIPDGTSRTIQVIEIPSAIGLPWASGPLAFPEAVGSRHPREIVVGLADGSTHWLDRDASTPVLLALLSPDGGEEQDLR